MMPRPIRAACVIPSGAQFGAPRDGGRRSHQGTDYHCPIGTSIYATGDGRVVSNVGETAVGVGYGNYITIAYAGGRVTLDGHMRSRSPLAAGTIVNSDTIVGEVGTTGNAIYADPPGSHDHHQVWLSGALTDPESYYGIVTASLDSTPIEAISNPITENEMRVYTISDGGLQGTIWGLAPGAMCCAANAADGLLLAKVLNPSGAPISVSEKDLRTIAGYLGIPNTLIASGVGGVNWSYVKDLASKIA
jgi:hypothetical protein